MIAFFKYLQKFVNREFSSSIFPEERCTLNKFVRCLMSQVVFLSRGEHCLTGWEYVLTDIIIIRDFIVGPPVLDDVALCRDKSLLLSRSDVSVLDSPSPTDKGWTARWVSVARIHGSPSLSLPPSTLSSSRSSTNSNRINYLGPSVEHVHVGNANVGNWKNVCGDRRRRKLCYMKIFIIIQ